LLSTSFAKLKTSFLGFQYDERPGSGDGEREASMTRQIPFEPLPASVLLGRVGCIEVWSLRDHLEVMQAAHGADLDPLARATRMAA
jgi:hypothetical protein